ncbi:hypothetical protein ANN_10048 [Periplaneta americana]|uniref:Uncharacterized protein n=1 Tax=Periplaneta americana TaxID=6978 RepID=A0ABQ8TQ34_PERAM|nr:hypothetical protein ANN_10048 [Periplaneta americana]
MCRSSSTIPGLNDLFENGLYFQQDAAPPHFHVNSSGRQHSMKCAKCKRCRPVCTVVQQEGVESIPASSYQCTMVHCVLCGAAIIIVINTTVSITIVIVVSITVIIIFSTNIFIIFTTTIISTIIIDPTAVINIVSGAIIIVISTILTTNNIIFSLIHRHLLLLHLPFLHCLHRPLILSIFSFITVPSL